MVDIAAIPEPVAIDLDRTAIIVVDMQNAFASKGGMLDLAGKDISYAPAVIDVHQRLLGAGRQAGVKIVYLAMTYDEELTKAGGPESPNYQKEFGIVLMREQPELGKVLVDGSWDWQIVDELAPQPGDLLVRKSRYSGFVDTDLDSYLRSEGIRNLLFTGIATNVCVESTARDAFFNEYWPILIEDAMTHVGPEFCQQATLWNFENLFGWVSNSQAVMDAFATRGEQVAPTASEQVSA